MSQSPNHFTRLDQLMEEARQRALKRRKLLVEAGYSTYTLTTRNGVNVILCLCCGFTSGHPKDMENRYCAFCHDHHSEWVAEEGADV